MKGPPGLQGREGGFWPKSWGGAEERGTGRTLSSLLPRRGIQADGLLGDSGRQGKPVSRGEGGGRGESVCGEGPAGASPHIPSPFPSPVGLRGLALAGRQEA